MPNRIIKESIKRSPEIDELSWFEEVVFYRLIVTADDYGRLDGRSVVLKNDLFPTKETITKKAIEDAIAHLTSVGLLIPYVDAESGMPYLAFRKWEKHQIVRNKHSKFPAPPNDLLASCKQLRTDCKQTITDCMSESNPIQSESNPIQSNAREVVTVQRYASDNLKMLGVRAMEEINSFCNDLSDDIVRHAIDNALDAGARTWSYVRAILNRYCDEDVKTVGEAKASDERFQKRKKGEDEPVERAPSVTKDMFY